MTWGVWDDLTIIDARWLGLSNDATAIAWRANTWARGPGNPRPGFITLQQLRGWSGGISAVALKEAVTELLDAGAPFGAVGILEPVEGGYLVHGPRVTEPPRAPVQPLPAPSQKLSRSEAGRLGGAKSAESRRNSVGSAQPSSKQTAPPPEANAEAHSKQTPKQSESASKQTPEAPEAKPETTDQFASKHPIPLPKQPAAVASSPEPEAREVASKQTAAASKLPSNLAEALELPICERAAVAVKRPDLWPWILPEQWREVTEVVEEFARSSQRPRAAGPPNRDEGVLRILERYAEGNMPSSLKRVAREQPQTESFQRKKLGLAGLFAPESFGIALSAAPVGRESGQQVRADLRRGPRQPNTLDHLDDQAHAAAIGAKLE
jgi:hypothetical protein